MSSLLQDSALTPMQAESMQMIMSSGELLLTIVNDVLDYSKLESGNVEIEIKHCNLQETLSSTIHSMSLKGTARNVSVQTRYDPNVPEFIHTDASRLSQVLYNLGTCGEFLIRGVGFSWGVLGVSLVPDSPPRNHPRIPSPSRRTGGWRPRAGRNPLPDAGKAVSEIET